MLPKIIVRQTHIQINNYEVGDCPKIERTFSIYDKTYHAYYPKGLLYDAENKILFLPKGIDIFWVENALYESAVIDYSYDEFDYIESIKIRYLPRDDVQRQAIRFMIGEGEYQINKGMPSLSVNLNTGKGKTYCSIAAISFLSMKSIIITSSVDWLNQWKDFIVEYTNIKPEEILFISGSASINRLFKKGASKYKMFLVTHSTLKSYGDSNGWENIGKLFKLLRVGIKIYDEAHLNFDNMMYIDSYTNTYKTYYVTATPKRSSEDEDRIYQLYMKNIPAIDLFDEQNDPHTKYISFRYNSHPTPVEASNCKNQYGLDRNKYTNYVVHKDNFNMLMHVLIHRIMNTAGKTLLYVGTNNAIQIVRDWIYAHYPNLINNVGIYTSITTEHKEEQLDRKIILSTTKSAGAAMDIKKLKLTIVLAEPFKSKVTAQQTFGRTRDEDTIYIEIVDDGFFYTKNYYMAKQEVFEKYATSCTEVKISDDQLYNKSNELYNQYLGYITPAYVAPEWDRNPNSLITPAHIFMK